MGLSPGIKSFLIGKKALEAAEDRKAKIEQEKIEQKRIAEEFKNAQTLFGLNKKKLEADLRRDEIEAEAFLNSERIESLRGNKPLIRGVQGPIDLFPDPNSGQAPIEQQESSIFQGLTGEIEIPQEELESVQQFAREQAEQAILQTQQESLAEETGPILREDLKDRASQEEEEFKSILRREEERIDQEGRIKLAREKSRLQRDTIAFTEQVKGGENSLTSKIVADDSDKIFKLESNLSGTKEIRTRKRVQGALIENGITNFENIRAHRSYIDATSTINSLFRKSKDFIIKQYNLTEQEFNLFKSNPELIDSPEFIERAKIKLKGKVAQFFGIGEADVIRENMSSMTGFVSRTTGGDKGSRLSDPDIKRAEKALPDQTLPLKDAILRDNELHAVYQEQFDKFYASLSPEQRQYQVDTQGLPFRSDLPSLNKGKKRVPAGEFSSITIDDPRVQGLAKRNSMTPGQVLKELQR